MRKQNMTLIFYKIVIVVTALFAMASLFRIFNLYLESKNSSLWADISLTFLESIVLVLTFISMYLSKDKIRINYIVFFLFGLIGLVVLLVIQFFYEVADIIPKYTNLAIIMICGIITRHIFSIRTK